MSRYWEFAQKNVFSELLSLLGRITQENLTHQIEYLKVENEILRKRVGIFVEQKISEEDYKIKKVKILNDKQLLKEKLGEIEKGGWRVA